MKLDTVTAGKIAQESGDILKSNGASLKVSLYAWLWEISYFSQFRSPLWNLILQDWDKPHISCYISWLNDMKAALPRYEHQRKAPLPDWDAGIFGGFVLLPAIEKISVRSCRARERAESKFGPDTRKNKADLRGPLPDDKSWWNLYFKIHFIIRAVGRRQNVRPKFRISRNLLRNTFRQYFSGKQSLIFHNFES